VDETHPPSTASLLEQSLEQAIDRLTKCTPTSESKRILIEARRLRGLMANWRSIPPSVDVRREMMAKVMSLSASAAAESAGNTMPPPKAQAPVVAPKIAQREGIVRAVTQPSVAAVRRPITTVISPGVTLVRPKGIELETMAEMPGVDLRFIPAGAGGMRSAIITMAPGSELPERQLPTGEALYVALGSALVGEIEAKLGDVCQAEPGSSYPRIRSQLGCTLFVVVVDPPADE
jgi:hypothetical protein